jgi:hypothetical protein
MAFLVARAPTSEFADWNAMAVEHVPSCIIAALAVTRETVNFSIRNYLGRWFEAGGSGRIDKIGP